MQGTVVTAKKLDQATIEKIEARLAKLFNEPVELIEKLDPKLLAGIVIYAGGRRFDGSARGLLEAKSEGSMERDLLNVRAMTIDAVEIGAELQMQVDQFAAAPGVRPVGRILSIGDGIANVDGLAGCRYNELLDFGNGAYGIAFNLLEDVVGAVLLIGGERLTVGGECMGTGRVIEIPVGEGMIGRVVDPIGRPLDEGGTVSVAKTRPLEAPAAAIIDRKAVTRPLQTGIASIDSMVPIGKGQRELIIGDRQTGKTAIAIDTILNQKDTGTLCVYVAIGQKASTVSGVLKRLREAGAMKYTVLVCSTASDSASMQYLAPYAGCAIAEEFMYSGRDVLIVYDDLSKHAVAYRAMSLLLRRPPGREAYPGDVFYLHSRLLERAAQLADDLGGGSITALPIIETNAGDISAYIPTNVISITDGQIFLSSDLFNSGTRPAVNVGLSVSRVGGSAQTKAMRKVSGQLRLDLAQYRELAVFSQFGSDLDHATRERLDQGERLTQMLIQAQYAPYTMAQQVVLLYAVTRGLLTQLSKEQLGAFKAEFPAYVAKNFPHILSILTHEAELTEQTEHGIREAVSRYLKR